MDRDDARFNPVTVAGGSRGSRRRRPVGAQEERGVGTLEIGGRRFRSRQAGRRRSNKKTFKLAAKFKSLPFSGECLRLLKV